MPGDPMESLAREVGACRAGTPLDEAGRANTGASADGGAQSIGAMAGPITGPMGMLGHPPR